MTAVSALGAPICNNLSPSASRLKQCSWQSVLADMTENVNELLGSYLLLAGRPRCDQLLGGLQAKPAARLRPDPEQALACK